MPSMPSPGTKSGIITSTDGQRHIPASLRADGSSRKEIKIRPGYKPPEDVEVYKNRTAEAWKTRGMGSGVPGAAVAEQDDNRPSSNKNAKRREARKRAKAAGEDVQDGASGQVVGPTVDPPNKQQNVIAIEQEVPPSKDDCDQRKAGDSIPDSEAEKDKQARNLRKKLRQARELREKKDKGENLLPEQFAKVIKINELIRQLDSLGFDDNGERKEQ